jgi:hypothetical protein
MIKMTKALLVTVLFIIPVFALAAGEKQGTFSPYVDGSGSISPPKDFRIAWVHLGTWVATSKAPVPGAESVQTTPGAGLHDVYTQPESVKAYQKTGRWPDGTVVVKEVRAISWDDLPTGHVMYAGERAECFVMVKDAKGRFKGNPHWGDGWGWALFRSADPKKNVSASYKADCMSCHEVAKDTDRVFVHGYPTLRK